MRRIVVVGSSNTDMVVTTPRLPLPGETVMGSDFVMAAGGKGANQAVAAARLGGEVAFVACLGRDLFGDEALGRFREEGIDTRCVVRDPQAPSGAALIMVGSEGQNIIAVAPGANSRLTSDDIKKARDLITDAGVVLLQLEIPLAVVAETIQLARTASCIVILNPAPAMPLPQALLQQVDILTPNEIEAMLLTGCPTPETAAQELLNQGVKTIIVTLGAAGVLLGKTGLPLQHIPGFQVIAVDTTAAGDAFNGGLAAALARGESLETAIRYAQAAAALSVTKRGAQPSLQNSDEVQQFLKQHVK
jgi:ribokinase